MMPGRILTLQRQARELGRLRTGYTDTSGPKARPVRSQTWIVTSHAEHYVQAAAEVWGGTVEKWQPLGNGAEQYRAITEAVHLDAILPPGDPLSQAYEMWSKGGAQRRCDGMTESLADRPCLCRQQFGDAFWETAPKDGACKVTTRLNVILPEMPDIGAWRVETHSYYSANEMAAAVDVLKGSIGEAALIPVRLRIEQRTRVAKGRTKQFPVVAVELRGGTAGQVLAGSVSTVAVGSGQRAELGATAGQVAIEGPQPAPAQVTPEAVLAAARKATTVKQWREIWQIAADAKLTLGEERRAELVAIGVRLKAAEQDTSTPAPVATGSDGEPLDADLLWQQIVALAPWQMSELRTQFAQAMGGVPHDKATEEELEMFLRRLKAGDFTKPSPADDSAETDEPPF
ncbi:recombination directionality factor [Sphaerisporangium aureirubrum]|uniref:PE-PGRS family protein n=1 Tax=Sphaerisporangium aureirubrum TaxID=1544736 RepID=A0ABW1NEV0_9ACTN